jgi:hypothetical protein
MKTITEIIAGAQGLLNISYALQDVFEEYLTEEYKTFLHILRVLEDAQNPLLRSYAGTASLRNKSMKAWKIHYLGRRVLGKAQYY